MKRQIILVTALLLSVAVFAQSGHRYGRGFLNEKSMVSINSDNIEFTIYRSGVNINVEAKAASHRIGVAWDVKGSNKLTGKVNFSDGVFETFEPKELTVNRTKTGVKGVKVVLANDPGGSPVKTTILSADGSFSFTDVPKGTYKLSVNDHVIATGWKIGEE